MRLVEAISFTIIGFCFLSSHVQAKNKDAGEYKFGGNTTSLHFTIAINNGPIDIADKSSSKMQTKSTMPDIDGKVVALINKSTENDTKPTANVTSDAKGSISSGKFTNSTANHNIPIYELTNNVAKSVTNYIKSTGSTDGQKGSEASSKNDTEISKTTIEPTMKDEESQKGRKSAKKHCTFGFLLLHNC